MDGAGVSRIRSGQSKTSARTIACFTCDPRRRPAAVSAVGAVPLTWAVSLHRLLWPGGRCRAGRPVLGRRRRRSRAPATAAQHSAAAASHAAVAANPRGQVFAALAVLAPGAARPDVPGVPGEGVLDAGVPVLCGGAVAAGGALNVAVSSAAPSWPATTTAVSSPSCVGASASSSPISKKPGPGGAGVSAVSPAGLTAGPWLVIVTSAQSYPRRSPERVWTAAQQPHVAG